MNTHIAAMRSSHHRARRAHSHHRATVVRTLQFAVRAVMFGVVGLAVLSVAFQLAYPWGNALPFSKIGGLDVGGKTRATLIAQLDDYAQYGETTVKTPSKSWKTKWQNVGVTVDREASADVVLEYSWWERLLPFSSIMRVIQSQEMPLIAVVDDNQVQVFAEKIVAEDKQAAQEAVVKIENGQVKVDKAKDGYRYTTDAVKRQVKSALITNYSTLELIPQPIPPVHGDQELQTVTTQANNMLGKKVTLKVAAKTHVPLPTDIGSWLMIGEHPETKKLQVTMQVEKVQAYIAAISKDVITAPGTMTITLLDGQEIGRTPGPGGQSVAMGEATTAIEQTLRGEAQQATVSLKIVAVPPNVNYVRTYSQASSGLQAILEDWDRVNPGQYGVVIRELGGGARYAEWQADKKFVTASTFKMFLAFVVLTKIERGELSYGQQTDMGWTVDACLNEMILRSTNPCAISFLNLVGWAAAEQFVKDSGFPATNLNNQHGGEKYTSVRDEANFLLRLQSGTLMGGEGTAKLLDLMKRQVWRGGIPAGVPRGTPVANKVGFYNGWKHDVAIVYAPKGTYILAIMSQGGSDGRFADLSRKVYNFFNQ